LCKGIYSGEIPAFKQQSNKIVYIMPFKSEAQRKYLWANEPEIAREWPKAYGSKPVGKKKSKKKGKKK